VWGIGKRCNNYSLPKPLNLVQGKHMIEYVIESIFVNEIYIIYNVFLNEYNFCEILVNKFKHKKLHFSCVDYLTRGAVESAFIGIQNFNNLDNENIVFLDNDNLHTFNELKHFENDFIGYGVEYSNPKFSFIKIINNNVVGIEEKNKISDNYCCGFYGFKNQDSFKKYARKLLDGNFKTKNEFYFSQLYKLKIQENELIEPHFIEHTKHIGSYSEIVNNKDIISKNKLRVCFDLDNTLVTYPTIINDYSSVKPIHKNIQLLNNLKNDGHEIIIYTARRMATHKGNIGKVIKDVANVTINTLENFDIHYDELIFGKPIADIYIDDRAINPYINDLSYFGLFYTKDEFIPNKIQNNKYNQIKKFDNYILKSGPYDIIKGELFYYKNIPFEFQDYFSKLIDFNKKDEVQLSEININNMIPISLGWNCSSAIYRANTLNQRKNNGYKTCPFDLCVTPYLGLCKCILDDFDRNKFFNLRVEYDPINKQDCILNEYNIWFNHESEKKLNDDNIEWYPGKYMENDFKLFKERYENRIENFFSYLKGDLPILFIFNNQHDDPKYLVKILKFKYPKLKYQVLLLDNFEKDIFYNQYMHSPDFPDKMYDYKYKKNLERILNGTLLHK